MHSFNGQLFKRSPIIDWRQLELILKRTQDSLLRIRIRLGEREAVGSAFLGETPEHQKVLFTAKHLFPSTSDSEFHAVHFICENPSNIPIFSINFEDYNKENIFLQDDPDSAAIILNEEIVGKLGKDAFVSIGEFIPIEKAITIRGFPGGMPYYISTGWITEFNEHKFSHTAGSIEGSSGSMILGFDGNVAGIHCGTESDDNHNFGIATNINYVIRQIHKRYSPYDSPLSTNNNPSHIVEYWNSGAQRKNSAYTSGMFIDGAVFINAMYCSFITQLLPRVHDLCMVQILI